ncbi:MAG: Fur family transcriptional regulator [Spirochaetota bacterium]
MHIEQEWGETRLKESNYRLTRPRRVILDVLRRTSEHLSAEEVYQQVYRVYPAIGLTTVYRTLELFVQVGLVHKFEFGDGKARYEINLGPEAAGHHHHLVCVRCTRIIDYADFVDEELELIRKTEERLQSRHDFTIHSHAIEFYGLCGSCRREREKGT